MRSLAHELGIEERITWLGHLSHGALRHAFAGATCLCLPSVEGRDGFDGVPNVMLEAMASGLPVVGFQSGGLCEVLTEETGWPVVDCSASALHAALQNMASNPEALEERRRNARRFIEENYDSTAQAAKRASLFRKAL